MFKDTFEIYTGGRRENRRAGDRRRRWRRAAHRWFRDPAGNILSVLENG